MSVAGLDEPTETVVTRIRFAVAQRGYRPHLLQARFLKERFGVQRGIPLRKIEDGKIKATVRGRVYRRRDPLLILQVSILQAVPRGAVRNNVCLADYAGRRHVERLENPLLNKVAIEFAGDSMNQDAESQVAQVAVTPARAGWVCRGECFNNLRSEEHTSELQSLV